jgi:hypothetical protein
MEPSVTPGRRLALAEASDPSHYQIEASVRVKPRGPSVCRDAVTQLVCRAHYRYHSRAETQVLRSPISDLTSSTPLVIAAMPTILRFKDGP